MTIYGFMQNYGRFAVNLDCTPGNAALTDMIGQANTLGLLKATNNGGKIHIYAESTDRRFGCIGIGFVI